MEKALKSWWKIGTKKRILIDGNLLPQKEVRLFKEFSKGSPEMGDTKLLTAGKEWLHRVRGTFGILAPHIITARRARYFEREIPHSNNFYYIHYYIFSILLLLLISLLSLSCKLNFIKDMCVLDKIQYIQGLVLFIMSGIHCGSWNVSSMDKKGLVYANFVPIRKKTLTFFGPNILE